MENKLITINGVKTNFIKENKEKEDINYDQNINYSACSSNEEINIQNKFMNINIDNIKEIKTISEHKGYVNFLLLLKDGRLASCSGDRTIKIFNIANNYYLDLTIYAHDKNIPHICEICENKIVSCSEDKTIKIWTIFNNTYKCEKIIKDNTEAVSKVISLTINRFASCSWDKLINVYESKYPYNKIVTLKGHTNCVFSIIQLRGRECIVSSGYEFTIRFWNILTYENETIISIHSCSFGNDMFEYDNKLFVSGIKVITIININKREIIKQIINEELKYIDSFMLLNKDYLLFGNNDYHVNYFSYSLYELNMRTWNCKLVKKDIHNGFIQCIIRLNENTFITSSIDYLIKIWK